ncbi:MAG: Coenzyme F420 hydrogenase/dehydrogenase, beta subunit C-terminal domain [Paludibacteraceae bacterium]|nr:Coenzyme F420 hydrogenase/dehydrogenase, beta subunit C-terminal domain [Paludibacteraceae bacterium]
MITIKDKHNCCGCSACAQKCPKQCISMQEDEEGFLYPKVDLEECVDCRLCERVCPVIEPLKIQNGNDNIKAFAAINNNEAIRLESSSGGVFTAIAEKIIKDGGKVFGAKFSEDFKSVIHSWTDNLEGLIDFRGSKYLQSSINDNYKDCELFLKSGEKVLFSGTPCQIQGLKKYLGKDYDNLITIDFICHGVPSPLLWKKYVEYQEHNFKSNVIKASFRNKNHGWKNFSMSLVFKDKSEYCATLDKDPYMQMFLKDTCLRESCYNCPSKGIKRVSDITIADFWGIQYEYPEFDDNEGTSFVIIHNLKLIHLLSDDCIIKEIDLEKGAKHNSAIEKSCTKHKVRLSFFKDLNRLPFNKMIKKYAITPWYINAYRLMRRHTGKIIKKLLNKKI